MRRFYRPALGLFVTLLLAVPVFAQAPASATPVPAVLFTSTPDNIQVAAPTATPASSPAPVPSARLQALDSAGNVNVRQLPEIESEVLGTISHGTEYTVLRKYFRWYELRYDLSPNGRAWIYGDLVDITGDTSRIEVIENPDVITIISQALDTLSGENTQEGTEGDSARTIQLATDQPIRSQSAEVANRTPLPTFTPPAPPRSTFTDRIGVREEISSALPDLPPIVPIIALGALGLVGLLIGLLRD